MVVNTFSRLFLAVTVIVGTTGLVACGGGRSAVAPKADAPAAVAAPTTAAPLGDSVVIAPGLKRLCHIDDVDADKPT